MIRSTTYIRIGDDLTATDTYGTPSRVPRAKVFPIRITLPLTAEMAAQIDATKEGGEDRVALIRQAIEREIKRRSRQK